MFCAHKLNVLILYDFVTVLLIVFSLYLGILISSAEFVIRLVL